MIIRAEGMVIVLRYEYEIRISNNGGLVVNEVFEIHVRFEDVNLNSIVTIKIRVRPLEEVIHYRFDHIVKSSASRQIPFLGSSRRLR